MIPYVQNDGGRTAAGFKGNAGDCVVRAIAIATQLDYREVYDEISRRQRAQRITKSTRKGVRSIRNGTYTNRKWFKDYMREIGFEWVPCMAIGTGCITHLVADELPSGRIIVSLSRHYAAVIDGVLHDSYNSGEARHEIGMRDGVSYSKTWARCVYGYWRRAA